MAQIVKPFGATKKKTIVGRGASSKGRACGRGHDGQNSRSDMMDRIHALAVVSDLDSKVDRCLFTGVLPAEDSPMLLSK